MRVTTRVLWVHLFIWRFLLTQNIDVRVDPLLPETLTLTLTLIVLVPAPRPRIAPNRRLHAHRLMSSDDNRYPILI